MIDKDFQNGIYSKVIRRDPKESFEMLLNCKEPGKYALRVNTKYSSIMPHAFWAVVSRGYWPLSFVDLPEDIFYEIVERRSLDDTSE
jgi:hypothetical protein